MIQDALDVFLVIGFFCLAFGVMWLVLDKFLRERGF